MAELCVPTLKDVERAVNAYVKRTGVPISDLSFEIFGHRSHLSDILRGGKDPRLSTLRRIAERMREDNPPDRVQRRWRQHRRRAA